MSKKINTTSIGLFIVTGVALGVTGLLLFSSSKMFSRTYEQIVYFDGSLNGLHEGAPVKYRGVTIGSVKRVMVRFNQAEEDHAMPVLIEIEDKLVHRVLGDAAGRLFYARSTEEAVRAERIKAGLRATLQTESLVTGVLYVDIQIDPHAPPPVFHQLEKIYIELPSEPTRIQQLMSNLANLDLNGLETNLNGLITRLDTTVGQLKMADINAGVTNLLFSVNRLVANPDLTNGLAAIPPTLAEANRALVQIRGAGENLRVMLAPDSPVRNDLDQALEQLAGASQSISSLADYLKQHPNSLITGREVPNNKP